MYLWLQVPAHGGCERDLVQKMNHGHQACESLSSVLSNRELGLNSKTCLYQEVIVTTASCGAETWGMRSVERRKANVLR